MTTRQPSLIAARSARPGASLDPAIAGSAGCLRSPASSLDSPPRQLASPGLRSPCPASTASPIACSGGASPIATWPRLHHPPHQRHPCVARAPAELRTIAAGACDDAQMPSRARAVDPGRLAQWCIEHLGSPPVDELFRSGNLSAVIGLRLADGREVVVKVRPDSPRIAACVEVQRRMYQAGYPCPRPLTGATSLGGDVATAEAYVHGGATLPTADHAAAAFAEAFARLIRLAPRPAEVSTLDPAPSWAAWNHGDGGLWPRSEEDPDVDLNEVAAGAEWIDDAGRHARDRLRLRASESDLVIGHCDWLAGNLRWSGDEPLVVHDWDSMIVESKAVLVGFAAALYSTVSADQLATVEDTERFLDAYCQAQGREFSEDERQRSWAAGLWTRAYDAKYQHTVGQPVTSLSEHEARDRLRRTTSPEGSRDE